MTDYRKISNCLIGALSDIIDIAQTALAHAEEEILSDDGELPPIHRLPPLNDDDD